jgi:gas vesicle protein
MNNTSKVLIAMAAGAAVGIAMGILFAPAKGEETREALKKKGKNVRDDLAHGFKSMKEKCKETEEVFN